MRIVQAVVAVAPPLLILWMGGTYLVDAGRLLLAPGVPVGFDYKSPEGAIHFRAEGYRLDVGHRAAAAWGLRATRAGATLGTVASVEARGLDPFALRPVVRVRGVRVRLVRDQRGFDLLRLLPEKKGPPSTIPYAVTVLDAQLLYVDRTFKRPLQQVAQTDRVVMDGVGDDWRAEGKVRLPGVGTADARAQALPSVGTTLDLRSDTLRLERVAASLVPGLAVKSLIVRGPVRLDLPKKGAARVAAVLRVEGQGIRYQKYALDRFVFEGKATPLGGTGTATVALGGVRARFQGSATLKSGGGRVLAEVPSPGSLPAWVRAYLPPKAGFQGARYAGWVSWSGKNVQASGLATAARATYGPDTLRNVRAQVAYAPERIDVRGLTTTWNGAILAGDASYEPRTKAIRAAVLAPRVELAAIARRLGNASGVSGPISGEALVTGTVAQPQIEGRLSGRVALRGRALGDVEARGAWLAGAARIDRLRVSGPLGAIVAGGTVRPDGTLDIRAEARGIRVERVAPGAKGLVSANLKVGGTLHDPKATGRLEAYRLAYAGQTLPAAGFDLAADRRRVDLTLFTAVRGTARLSGRVGASLVGPGVRLADPRTWIVDGRAALTGVQVGEIPGADAVGDLAGLLSIPAATLSGRLGDPVVKASLAADGLIAHGVRIDSVRGDVRADRRGASLSNLETVAAGGRITGVGRYAFAGRSGVVDLSVSNIQLSRLLGDVSQDVIVGGTVSAPRVHLAIRDGKPFGTAEGTLDAVTVNNVLAGDGNWNLDATGERVQVDASVGRLDPTLRALDVTAAYDVRKRTLAATVQAKDVPVQAVVAAIEANRQSSEEEADRLSTIKGDMSGTVAVVRTAAGELKVDATDLQAAAIRYLEVDYGTLTAASVVRRDGRWDLHEGSLQGPAGRFGVSGWVEENGSISMVTMGQDVKLAAFSPFAPDLAQLTGLAHFALTATGMVERPKVVGTAGVEGLFAGESKEAVGVSLDVLDVRDGDSKVGGVVRYGSRFGGLFTFATDWGYGAPLETASLKAKLDLGEIRSADAADPSKGFQVAPVNLIDLPGLLKYVDPVRSVAGGGTLSGGFTATGTLAAPRFAGGLQLVAEHLGIVVPGERDRPVAKIDDTLKGLKIDLGFDERNAPKLTASVAFSRGGTLTAMATLGDLRGKSVIETLSTTRDWKGLPVAGFVEIKDDQKVTVHQTVAGANTAVTVAGRVDASGPAATPLLAGAFVISNFETSLPTLQTGDAESGTMVIDPRFDLKFALAQAGRFRTATADLYLDGDLAVRGSLSDPVATAEMVTERGSIRLPGGLVRIDKGGQISFAYRRPLSGGTPASATIDLQGRSQLTLARNGSTTSQRYDITLDMQGDLLRENGLRFDATSDPGDLNKDEILTALGGTELLTGVAEGGSSAERNVRNAFAGFALPGLLDPVTSSLAQRIGFDYVSLEYNAYDQATVNFGRSLGQDFSFQGRQQVGTPTPGYQSIFDLRLSYNPRRLLPKLSRLSFTLGVDQERPWKASVEYGTRFGGGKGKARLKHVIFPGGGDR